MYVCVCNKRTNNFNIFETKMEQKKSTLNCIDENLTKLSLLLFMIYNYYY